MHIQFPLELLFGFANLSFVDRLIQMLDCLHPMAEEACETRTVYLLRLQNKGHSPDARLGRAPASPPQQCCTE